MSEQFDLFEGIKLKEEGQNKAALSKKYILELAREHAYKIALNNPLRECSIDDVQRIMIKDGIDLGMAAGSVFKGKDWEHTGKYVRTHRKSSHARNISVWRLKP